MNDHEFERNCIELVEKCKHEAKQLVEFTATRRKVHWTHPSFVSFCISVEDILSYGVKRKYQSFRTKVIMPSGRILQDLGKSLPEAAAIYEKCFDENSMKKEDYAYIHVVSMAERKVGWIRAALVEGKLQTIVRGIMKNPGLYYTKQSVLCHPVYGEIFEYLIDGPCSIRFSRLKTLDACSGTPSPAEIVERHNQVLSISTLKGNQDDGRDSIATEVAWAHVRSLYQSTSSTCLFGKNNIMVQPPGFTQPLQGYLTLLQDSSLLLKWIPNSLLQDSSNAQSVLWKTILSIDIVLQIAHIHCHRTPGYSAELIMVGYDGIAHPPLLFPHQPSFFLFLECLENSLLPQGCLEPPLWYIKEMATKSNKAKQKECDHGHRPLEDEGEWFDVVEVWNQVFRIRYGSRPQVEDIVKGTITATPPMPHPLPLNIANHSGSSFESSWSESSESEESDDAPLRVTVEKPGSLARGDWEKFQSKMSRQLLARYFYSWFSYCRHVSKVRAHVSHLVGNTSLGSYSDGHTHPNRSLSREDWDAFLQSDDHEDRWPTLVKHIYIRGIDHELRKEVWPYLLGLYPVKSTQEERVEILKMYTEKYNRSLSEWQKVEATKKEIEEETARVFNGHRIGSFSPDIESPSLSTISRSSSNSRDNSRSCSPDPSHDQSHDIPSDKQHFSSRNGDILLQDQPCAELNYTGREYVEDKDDVFESSSQSLNQVVAKSHDNQLPNHLSKTVHNYSIASSSGLDNVTLNSYHDPEEMVISSLKLDAKGKVFVKELYNIDKDIPRCDRDYWYFQDDANLVKVRNIICSFVWVHLNEGYSQGMCDLLSPLLVLLDSEPLTYACYLKLMESTIKLFPPNTVMNTRLSNVQALLQVMEPDFYQYLSDRPMGDNLFYAYRWLLVTFKREFSYVNVFRLWETVWAARRGGITNNFEEFIALAILKQFETAIMDARLDPSDILNLFTDLAEKKAIDGDITIRIAQETIQTLQFDLAKKDC